MLYVQNCAKVKLLTTDTKKVSGKFKIMIQRWHVKLNPYVMFYRLGISETIITSTTVELSRDQRCPVVAAIVSSPWSPRWACYFALNWWCRQFLCISRGIHVGVKLLTCWLCTHQSIIIMWPGHPALQLRKLHLIMRGLVKTNKQKKDKKEKQDLELVVKWNQRVFKLGGGISDMFPFLKKVHIFNCIFIFLVWSIWLQRVNAAHGE